MASIDARIAFDDRIDRVEALAEVTGDDQLATAETQLEWGWGVFDTKELFRVAMTFPVEVMLSRDSRIAQLLYKSTVTVCHSQYFLLCVVFSLLAVSSTG